MLACCFHVHLFNHGEIIRSMIQLYRVVTMLGTQSKWAPCLMISIYYQGNVQTCTQHVMINLTFIKLSVKDCIKTIINVSSADHIQTVLSSNETLQLHFEKSIFHFFKCSHLKRSATSSVCLYLKEKMNKFIHVNVLALLCNSYSCNRVSCM